MGQNHQRLKFRSFFDAPEEQIKIHVFAFFATFYTNFNGTANAAGISRKSGTWRDLFTFYEMDKYPLALSCGRPWSEGFYTNAVKGAQRVIWTGRGDCYAHIIHWGSCSSRALFLDIIKIKMSDLVQECLKGKKTK